MFSYDELICAFSFHGDKEGIGRLDKLLPSPFSQMSSVLGDPAGWSSQPGCLWRGKNIGLEPGIFRGWCLSLFQERCNNVKVGN